VTRMCLYKDKEGLALSTSCSLPEFIRQKKRDLGGRNLTVLVQGIDSYFRFDSWLHSCWCLL